VRILPALFVVALAVSSAPAGDKPVVGLIPEAQKPVTLDGKLDDWDGAFVTPVHVGHPDFANRGGQFLYLWDDKNLYVGLRCLDQKPAHVGTDSQLYLKFLFLLVIVPWVGAVAPLLRRYCISTPLSAGDLSCRLILPPPLALRRLPP
jgi:hypothetical protein